MIAIANLLIDALILLILVSSVMSWFHPDPRNTFVRLVNAVVEPLLHPIRAVMPAVGPFDLSPLVAFAVLMLLQRLLQGAL